MLRGKRRTVLTMLAIVLGALAAGFAASIALAGCSGEPSTPPTTPPATTADPSPTPTPTPTPTPDAATPPQRPDLSTVDAETAEAVAVYFLQLYPYVFATGDLTEWDALSHPECVYCAEVASGVEQMAANDDLSDDGRVEVLEVTSSETVGAAWWLVDALVRQSSASSGDGSLYDMAVVVVRENDRWLVRGVEPRRRA